MKKIITTVASSLLFMSLANAEVSMGISGMMISVDAEGTETLKTSANVEKKSIKEDAVAGEIFAEYNLGMVSLGVAVIPMEAEIGSESLTRTDKLTGGDVSGQQKASAEFSMHSTVYALVPLGSSGFYAKIGAGQVDVKTTEALVTGAKYADKTLDFTTIGFGSEKDLSNGMFIRAEGAYTDYDKIELKSTGSDAVSTINGEIETLSAKISIGKSF